MPAACSTAASAIAARGGPASAGQGLADGGLAAAGHADEDDVLHLAAPAGRVMRAISLSAMLLPRNSSAARLAWATSMYRPPGAGDAQLLRLEQQSGAGGVIDEVQHAARSGGRPADPTGETPLLGYMPTGVVLTIISASRVAVQVVVVVLTGAGDDHDLGGPQLLQHGAHRGGGAAAAQHQDFFARHGDTAVAPP